MAVMMRPRPLGSGVAAAAPAEVSAGAGYRGWAWRQRPRAQPRGVRVRGAPSPHAAAAASAVPAERHDGVRFRPFGVAPPRAVFGEDLEAAIEKAIYACRFMAFLAIAGSLAGSVLCFLKVLESSAHQAQVTSSVGLPI